MLDNFWRLIIVLNSQDFYPLVCGNKFKKISETIQDGQGGIYYVLRILMQNGGELSAGEISSAFGVSTARTAVMLATLNKKGFIEKTKAKNDARKTMCTITEQGKCALKDRVDKVFAVFDEYLMNLNESERQVLYDLLLKLLN